MGTSIETCSYTIFNRTVSLEARIISEHDKDESEEISEKTTPPAWSIYIYSIGESNDLRLVMPYLAAAATPYIGKNTGQLVEVR